MTSVQLLTNHEILAYRLPYEYNLSTMVDIASSYEQTLEYLYRFVDFSLKRNFRYDPNQFDLARMFELAAKLGDPQEKYPILHVAGTKGKGSVSVMCASALQSAGYRVGLYTSPHLDDYAERIQVNGIPISHADVVGLVAECREKIESVPRLTTFEITTALAYHYFALQGVTAAVIEVGLGGRLDATNICKPKVATITSISYDHTNILGSTLAEIATEKAGIIKPGVPVVSSPQLEEPALVLERIASERGSPLYRVGKDYCFTALEHSMDSQSLMVWRAAETRQGEPASDPTSELKKETARLTIPLLGAHQVENAATAYATLQVARAQNINIGEDHIQDGFRRVHWPGRFEFLRREPPIVVDSAHNRDSARRLRQALDDYLPDCPVILIFGVSEDKDIQGMLDELMPRIREVIVVKSFHPRAADPQVLADLVQQHNRPAKIIPDVVDALKEALNIAGHNTAILAAGSLFVAAGVRIAWFKDWSNI